MPAKKMRVELFDDEGNRYSVSFEGQVTREKALRLLDLVELLGGSAAGAGNPGSAPAAVPQDRSKCEKVRLVLQKHFPIAWFSSREVQTVFEQEYKEPISLSTVSTYLSRMTNKGFILKSGQSNNLKYKSASSLTQPAIRH